MKNRLPARAFTLIELLIVMAVTALLIFLGMQFGKEVAYHRELAKLSRPSHESSNVNGILGWLGANWWAGIAAITAIFALILSVARSWNK